MTEFEQQLSDRGFAAEDINFVVDYIEANQAGHARGQAAQLLHLIFLRVERDSAAGCALRRALGFSSDASLARAAKDFCVTKQYLHDLQAKLEEQLGPLSFLAPHAAPVPRAPSGGKKSRVLPRASVRTGNCEPTCFRERPETATQVDATAVIENGTFFATSQGARSLRDREGLDGAWAQGVAAIRR